jgi:PAS domain S-box-containing protein
MELDAAEAQMREALRRSQRSEQTLQGIFGASPVALAVFVVEAGGDPGDQGQPRGELVFVDVNEAWGRTTGHHREDTIGRPGAALNLWMDPEVRRSFITQMREHGRVQRLEAHMRRADGSEYFALVSGQDVLVNDERFHIVAIDDISAQKAVQAEMAELNASLDRRVRERTQELERALEHLKQMQHKLVQSEKLASLGSLVTAVAHELNTPIGNGLTVAGTLRDSTAKLTREMGEGQLRKQALLDYLTEMQAGTSLLERAMLAAADLVSDFKRVSVDQASEARSVFDLRGALQDALTILKPMLSPMPYEVLVDLPEGIRLNSFPGALEQVVGNLVNNAVQHGFAGRDHGQMRLAARMNGDQLRIEFSDDGVGMSADTLARIYDPFFTTALGQGGSGLGMHITYNLVTGPLGGEIDVQSRPGEGCRVLITLPLVAPGQRTGSAING